MFHVSPSRARAGGGRWRPRRRLLLGSLVVAVFLAGAVGRVAGRWLVVQTSVEAPDAIIVLASHEWERLPEAARLARAFPLARVLLTEPMQVTAHNCHDCGRRIERLAQAGINPNRIEVLRLFAHGTYGEALAALAHTQGSTVARLLIVTSPYHTRRALVTFRRVFETSRLHIGVQPAVEDSPATPDRWWLHPYDRAYVAYESAALMYYTTRYGVDPILD